MRGARLVSLLQTAGWPIDVLILLRTMGREQARPLPTITIFCTVGVRKSSRSLACRLGQNWVKTTSG